MHRSIQWTAALAALIAAASLSVMAYESAHSRRLPQLSTPYHAVALTNGQVFFGRIDELGTDYTVLRDVFYIQSRQNSGSSQVSNVLIKRGGEWHAPDRMILNRQQVLLIEPVKEDSQVARLIAEQNKTALAAPPGAAGNPSVTNSSSSRIYNAARPLARILSASNGASLFPSS